MRLALLLLVACHADAPPPPGSEPVPPPLPPTPDELVRQSIDQPPDERAFVIAVVATNVRSTGDLDPTGQIVIAFNRIPSGPEPEVRCPAIVMRANRAPEPFTRTCVGWDPVTRVNCTLADVWRRAIANGANRDQLATIAFGAPASTLRLATSVSNGSDVGPGWVFIIDGVEAYIPDDCATR